MSLRERIEWVFRVGLLVFILAAAAFLSAVTAMRFAVQGREVAMPDLIGKSSADAKAILEGRGLQLKVVDRVYGNIPANAVARQSPPAGERMKVGQNAHVVLSLGSQNVLTPSLIGESLRVARIQLLQVGLQLGEVSTRFCSSRRFRERAPPALASICSWRREKRLPPTSCRGSWGCHCPMPTACLHRLDSSSPRPPTSPHHSGPRARSPNRLPTQAPKSPATPTSKWLWRSNKSGRLTDLGIALQRAYNGWNGSYHQSS